MGKSYLEITPALESWLGEQHIFFVATAPLAATARVNCSPKGMDCLRILGPRQVAYLDLTGSGIETVAHVRENGRIVLMFCSFVVPPKIVRLHGHGRVLTPSDAHWNSLRPLFPDHAGARAILSIEVAHISDSCGFGVPLYEYRGQRETLLRSAEMKGSEGLVQYRREKNRHSIDGLPGLDVFPLDTAGAMEPGSAP